MNRKTILLTLTCLMITSTIFAQMKPFRFGLKVAPNVGWLSPDSDDYESDGSVAGFSWGFISDFTITENYFVGTGFNISYLNGKLKYPSEMFLDDDTIPTPGTLKRKYNFRYIDVPLTLKMKTNQFNSLQFYGQIGFSLGFNIKTKASDVFTYKIEDEMGDEYTSISDESSITDETTFLHGSLVLGGGLEYYIDNSTSIIVGLTYYNGLSNVLKGENKAFDPPIDQKAIPHFIELTLGVIF
nr:PorT family protein [Bacteroidota bacterium]